MTRRSVRLGVVALLVVAAVAVVGAGIGGAHGGYQVFLRTQEHAAPNVPEPIQVRVETGSPTRVPPRYRTENVTVELEMYWDGKLVQRQRRSMGFDDQRTFFVWHTPNSSGAHEFAINATYTVGDGAWNDTSRAVRLVDVAENGSDVAIRECLDSSNVTCAEAGIVPVKSGIALKECLQGVSRGPASTGEFRCYLDHSGPVSAMLAVPAFTLGALLVVVLVGGGVAVALGVGPPVDLVGGR